MVEPHGDPLGRCARSQKFVVYGRLYKATNPGGRNPLTEPERSQVGRLLGVLLKRQEEVGVAERVRVRPVLQPVLAVDVLHHLGVVLVEAWYDHLVEVNDDSVPVPVKITHHAVIERCGTRQFDGPVARRQFL